MFTDILWRFLILEMFVLGVLCHKTCSYTHPQEVYCTSDLVLRVKFHKEKFWPGLSKENRYKMEIEKVFKGNVEKLIIIDNRYVYVETTSESNFVNEHIYFIFGRNENGIIHIDSCSGNKPLVVATHFYIRRGLTKAYKTGCDCMNEMPEYSLDKECHWHYSFLVRRGQVCNWVKTRHFRKCRKGFRIVSN